MPCKFLKYVVSNHDLPIDKKKWYLIFLGIITAMNEPYGVILLISLKLTSC